MAVKTSTSTAVSGQIVTANNIRFTWSETAQKNAAIAVNQQVLQCVVTRVYTVLDGKAVDTAINQVNGTLT